MAKTVDLVRAEKDARDSYAEVELLPSPVRDERGVEHAIGERFPDVRCRSKLIAVSDALARVVVGHLAAGNVEAEVDQVRVDPLSGDDLQMMAVRMGGFVVPIRPRATFLRLWPTPSDSTTIVLSGDPAHQVEVEAEPDGWVIGAAIARALVSATA